MTFLPQRHYANAPITEAVIDFGLQLGPDASLESLGELRDHAYPQKDAVVVGQIQFAGTGTMATQGTIGWRFRADNGAYVYQARLNGFGMSRLAPYQSWTLFSAEARRLWNMYRDHVRPVALQRLGLRYINRIDIPLPMNDFGEYLLTQPVVGPHLPQMLSNYLMNLTIPMEGDVTATITEAILNQPLQASQTVKPDTVSILLDIDVFQVTGLSLSEGLIWQRLEHLRKIKNHVFESCITDKTRELFQ